MRFRRRYAAARLKSLAELTWVASRLAVVAAVLVWFGGMGWNYWQQSEYLRIQGVRYEGDIPLKLPATIPIRSGLGLFSFSAKKISTEAVRRFPELSSVSVSRALDRTVVIKGRYREPVAMLAGAAAPTGIDSFGVAFRIPPGRDPRRELPVIQASGRDLPAVVSCLRLWERRLPTFFGVVKKLECDRMRLLNVELSDGVIVHWGRLDLEKAVEKARNVQRLMSSFSPEKAPARLRFVTDDRIVMDAHWQPTAG